MAGRGPHPNAHAAPSSWALRSMGTDKASAAHPSGILSCAVSTHTNPIIIWYNYLFNDNNRNATGFGATIEMLVFNLLRLLVRTSCGSAIASSEHCCLCVATLPKTYCTSVGTAATYTSATQLFGPPRSSFSMQMATRTSASVACCACVRPARPLKQHAPPADGGRLGLQKVNAPYLAGGRPQRT